MFKKKKIKLFLQQDIHIKITSFRKRPFSIKKLIVFFYEIIFEVCYKFGRFALRIIKLSLNKISGEFLKTQNNFVYKMKGFRTNNPFSNLLILFLGLISIGFLLLTLSGISNAGLAINKILKLGYLGKQSLEAASNNLNEQDLRLVQTSLMRADYFFSNAQQEFSYLNKETQILLKIVPVENEAGKILRLGKLFSQTGQELIILGQKIENVKISSNGFFDQKTGNLPETLNAIEKSIQKIQVQINESEKTINELNLSLYPNKIQSEVSSLRNRFFEMKSSFSSLTNIFFSLRNLFENSNTILIVLQNNNELRPAGGFIGTLAELEMKNGVIENLKVESVYEKDGQLNENILPPHPIMNVNPRWFLRDSNWFADFPKSAKKIIEFYEKEGGETPKAIIAITPKLIADLLEFTGPIYLSKHDITLTSDNFIEIAQIGTSSSADDPENKPKQFLADFVPVLLAVVSKTKNEDKGKLLLIFQNNLSEKNIQFFSHDPKLQNFFLDLGWAGKLLDSKADYLNIISANLEGTKTDLFIRQNVSLTSEVGHDGYITNTLKITRENRLPKLSKTFNTSFLRILVPKGSELISNQGFDYKILDTKVLEAPSFDYDVLNWEKGIVRDLQTGTIIGLEENKTFFANWLKLDGGETKTATLVYRLPFRIEENKQYSLIIQKQPGTLPQKIEYRLNAFNFEPIFITKNSNSAKNGGLLYNFDLNQDKFFGFIFKKINGD